MTKIVKITYTRGKKSVSYLSQRLKTWRLMGLAIRGFMRGTYYIKQVILVDLIQIANSIGAKIKIEPLKPDEVAQVEVYFRPNSDSFQTSSPFASSIQTPDSSPEMPNDIIDWKGIIEGYEFYRGIFKHALAKSPSTQDEIYQSLAEVCEEAGKNQKEMLSIADKAYEILKIQTEANANTPIPMEIMPLNLKVRAG